MAVGDEIPKAGTSAVYTDPKDGSRKVIQLGTNEDGTPAYDGNLLATIKDSPSVSFYKDGKLVENRNFADKKGNQPTPVDELPANLREQVAAGSVPVLGGATPIAEATPLGPSAFDKGLQFATEALGGLGDVASSPAGQLVTDLGKSIESPMQAAGEGLKQGWNALNSSPAGALSAPDSTKAPVAPAPPQPGAGSFSVSSATRTPGAIPQGQPFDEAAERKRILGEVVVANAQSQAAKDIASKHLEIKATQEQYASDVLKAEGVKQKTLEQHDAALLGMQSELARLDTTIDPNRYWHNKSSGQVAMSAIAGALMGFAGKGVEYLQTIAHEVDRDVKAQQESYENAAANIKMRMAAGDDLYARARQRGLDADAASNLAYQARMGGMKSALESTVSNGVSVEAGARANELIMATDAIIAKKKQEFGFAASQKANLDASTALKNSQLQMMRAAASTPGVPVKPDKIIQAVDAAAANARTELAAAKKLVEKYGTAELFGPQENELRRHLHNYAIFTAKMKDPSSVVKQSEADAELEALGFKAGTWTTRNATALKLLEDADKAIDTTRQNTYDAHARGDFKTSTPRTPAELEGGAVGFTPEE